MAMKEMKMIIIIIKEGKSAELERADIINYNKKVIKTITNKRYIIKANSSIRY